MRVTFFPYQWQADYEEGPIRIFALTPNNETVYINVPDFTPYLYMELPSEIVWDETQRELLLLAIKKNPEGITPVIENFVNKRRLYGAHVKRRKNGGYRYRTFPYLQLAFQTKSEMNSFIRFFRHSIQVDGVGKVRVRYHEHTATPVLQLTTIRELPTAGWITAEVGVPLLPESRVLEYTCSWRTLSPCLDPELTDLLPSPLVASVDIEVNSSVSNRMPQVWNPKDKVFQISCIFARQGATTGQPDEECEKIILTMGQVDPETLDSDIIAYEYKTEADLFQGYIDLIRERKPNLIVGYNIMRWDFPYLMDRCKPRSWDETKGPDPKANGVYPELWKPFMTQGYLDGVEAQKIKVKWSSSAYRNQEFDYPDFPGIVLVDMMPIIQRDFKFSTYSLKAVAENFLGQTKDPLTPKGIFKCFRMGMKGDEKGKKALSVVSRYCVMDSYVTLRLFEHLQTWVGLCEMAKTCHVPIVVLYTKGQQVKMFSQIYRFCAKRNIVVENEGYKAKENEGYEGALVLDPRPGLHYNVVPFDFSSLYPSCIISYNLDFSTCVTDPAVPDADCHIVEWDSHTGCAHDTKIHKTKPKYILCGHYRYRFLKDPKGVLPTVIANLLDARKMVRKEIARLKALLPMATPEEAKRIKAVIQVLEKRQLSYKTSANSMYGGTGVRKGYLPFMPIAMATTAMGRVSITRAMELLETQFACSVVYGDTDSSYCSIKNVTTPTEIWDRAIEISTGVSKYFPEPMKLAFEDVIYVKFLIFTKKRYLCISCDRDGKISSKLKMKGVLLSRRDNSAFIREIYLGVVKEIFDESSFEKAIQTVITGVNRLYHAQVKLPELIVTKSVQNNEDYKKKDLPLDRKDRNQKLIKKGIKPRPTDPHWEEEQYHLKTIPAQAQLAERMRRRGQPVEAGARLEYLITDIGEAKAPQAEKIEDPAYFRRHQQVLKIDPNYYCHLLINPVDQALDVIYGIQDFMKVHHQDRVLFSQCMRELLSHFSPRIELIGHLEGEKQQEVMKTEKGFYYDRENNEWKPVLKEKESLQRTTGIRLSRYFYTEEPERRKIVTVDDSVFLSERMIEAIEEKREWDWRYKLKKGQKVSLAGTRGYGSLAQIKKSEIDGVKRLTSLEGKGEFFLHRESAEILSLTSEFAEETNEPEVILE